MQGEESITSADLSSDGSILAVSTVAELKLFRLHHRSETLRVHKVEINRGVSRRAAKLLQFSPDSKWLATTGADDSVQLQRLLGNNKSRQIPNAWPKAVGLKRLRRDLAKAKNKDSSLGNYNRSISCLAFSTDSRILAVSDNSGFLDTWVLEGYEDLTQEDDVEPGRVGSSLSSDDEDSEEDSPTVILGQHWIRNPAASLLVKLPAAPSVLSFRPSNTQSASAQGNGNTAVHPTRHNPHPHSHDLPHGEDRLFVITAKNQMYEFNVLSGKLSDWSRRNPTSSLPRAFRDLRDRAKGVLWDIGGRSERIWLYGVAWLWMFDLSKDLPVVGHELNELQAANGINGDVSLKRKRENEVSTSKHKRRDTGAGSKISETELGVGIGRKIRKLNGADVNGGEWISLDREQESASDEEGSYVLADEHNSALVKIRRGTGDVAQLLNGPADETDASETDDTRLAKRGDDERPPYWHTYKYRPILGIVPLGTETDDDDAAVDEEAGDNSPSGLEVALVERPLWEVDLPPQYHGNQEWDP